MSVKLHRNPPFRAEHLGSLLRTEELIKKRAQVMDKKANESELVPLEDRDIKEIVKIQKELGYKAMTDGEYRRHSKRVPESRTVYENESLTISHPRSVLGLFLPRS